MASFYRLSFTNVQTLTIPGSVHGLGTADLVYQVYDTAGNAIQEGTWHVDPTTFAITLTFAAPQSGSLAVLPAVASAVSPGPSPGPTPSPAAPGPGHMHPALRAMLTETVTHAAYAGQDHYGKPQYGAPVVRPARIQYVVTTVVNPQGQERTSTTKIVMDGDFAISVRDRLTLADGTSPAIQQVYSPTDPIQDWVDHHEVLL